MPVNYQQIREAIQKMGKQAPVREQELQARRKQAMTLLNQCAADIEILRQRLEKTLAVQPELRCAVPLEEVLNTGFDVPANLPPVTLWAADGSQIIPNQHLAVQFGVINVGMIRMAGGETPQQVIESELLYADELYTSQGYLVGEEFIALRRDFKERSRLLEAALQDAPPVLTLTDGPLELFREVRESREYQHMLEQYLGILSQMAENRLMTAGYVDKPRSDLVVRLLELSLLPEDKLDEAGQLRPLIGVGDAELFSRILQPGQRSAVFRLQSKTALRFSGQLAIHFFYLNVGRDSAAQIARVEVPAWVAKDPQQIAIIHEQLYLQSRQLGVKAFPYILHRAHEIAVVRFEERDRLLQMIQQELLQQGLQPGSSSAKQHHKDQPGKTRYKG